MFVLHYDRFKRAYDKGAALRVNEWSRVVNALERFAARTLKQSNPDRLIALAEQGKDQPKEKELVGALGSMLNPNSRMFVLHYDRFKRAYDKGAALRVNAWPHVVRALARFAGTAPKSNIDQVIALAEKGKDEPKEPKLVSALKGILNPKSKHFALHCDRFMRAYDKGAALRVNAWSRVVNALERFAARTP